MRLLSARDWHFVESIVVIDASRDPIATRRFDADMRRNYFGLVKNIFAFKALLAASGHRSPSRAKKLDNRRVITVRR